MKKRNAKRNAKSLDLETLLYRQAFQLWATLFNLEPSARTCQEAWRLRFITERAFARMGRRQKAIKLQNH